MRVRVDVAECATLAARRDLDLSVSFDMAKHWQYPDKRCCRPNQNDFVRDYDAGARLSND